MEGKFTNYISEEKKKINQIIHSFFKSIIISEEEASLRRFLKSSEDFVLQGGRRIHPISLIETFKGLAPEKYLLDFDTEIYDVSIAIELMHISSLMIDDLVDNEQFRHGKKTFHRFILDQDQTSSESPRSYQLSSAIYGGNLTSLLGSRIITQSNFDAELKNKALQLYLSGLSGITRGHLLDEYFKHNLALNQISLENYLILADKRAKQMETAVGLGAIFGNARQSQMQPLLNAMNKIGIIDQMKNDFEGSFGDPTLRSIDSDIKQGHATILTVLAYQQGTEQNIITLNKTLGNPDATAEEIAEVRDIYRDTGSVNFTKMYSNSLKNDVFHLINSIYPGLRKSAMEFYKELLHYLTNFGDT